MITYLHTLCKFFARADLFCAALVWLMFLVVTGTVAQREMGLYDAQQMYFSSWYFMAGGYVPLPAGMSVLALLAVGLACKLGLERWRLRNLGTLTSHIGALMLLVGGLAIQQTAQEGLVVLSVGDVAAASTNAHTQQQYLLPFSLELTAFEREDHPGTAMARHFGSRVIVHSGAQAWPAYIRMNEPLRFKGYTVYQSAVAMNDGTPASVLAVVKNPTRLFPYICTFVLAVGLLAHLLQAAWRRQASLVLLALGVALPAHAAVDADGFGALPIQQEGRLKPLDTYARVLLTEVSGKDALPDKTATDWLAELVLDPAQAYARRVFRIDNPAVADALALPVRTPRLYSFAEVGTALRLHAGLVNPLLAQKPEARALVENQLVGLYAVAQKYFQVSRALTVLLPVFEVTAPENLPLFALKAPASLTYLDVHARRAAWVAAVDGLDPARPTPAQRELLRLARQYRQIGQDVPSAAFAVLPPLWAEDGERWFAPWDMLASGRGSPVLARFIGAWQRLAMAYKTGDDALWQRALTELENGLSAASTANPARLRAEVAYNTCAPFKVSAMLYVLAGLATLAFLLGAARRLVWPLGVTLLGAGVVVHGLGFAARIWVMQRPPVATLYESVIFVGLVVPLVLLGWELKRRDGVALLLAAIGGAALQAIGLRYSAEGDSMGMLTAVLNTNFWLAVHVLTIALGYSFCFVTAGLAHLALVRGGRTLHRPILLMGLTALLFTLVGTLLGGVWADQSWGRFWGWDPKENGALLIVLWLLFAFHGSLSGLFPQRVFYMVLGLTAPVVALAWFGVNLLGVGLHSYGFTTGAALKLAAFCLGDMLLLAVLYRAGGKRHAL
ncbi:MAG: hypothetical protein GC134_08200 [Proteobacteria bacterium]|nr:hypothetical protein [Pseudomonadota bacterium]